MKVHLLGRYMLPDRREFPCQIINMSPGGLALLAPGIGNVGDRVIAYLDHIGRVEGKITRIIDNGFAMTIGATARKRDKLAGQLQSTGPLSNLSQTVTKLSQSMKSLTGSMGSLGLAGPGGGKSPLGKPVTLRPTVPLKPLRPVTPIV